MNSMYITSTVDIIHIDLQGNCMLFDKTVPKGALQMTYKAYKNDTVSI